MGEKFARLIAFPRIFPKMPTGLRRIFRSDLGMMFKVDAVALKWVEDVVPEGTTWFSPQGEFFVQRGGRWVTPGAGPAGDARIC